MAMVFLPGTFIHEVAHFLMGLILLVPVGQFELMPEVEEEGMIKMGSVPIGKTDFIRRTMIGFAPLLVGVGLIFSILYFLLQKGLLSTPWIIAVTIYAIFVIGNTMFLSKKDIEGIWVFILFLVLIFAILWFLGVNIGISEGGFIYQTIIPTITKANIFLAIPIGVDLILILILSFVLV